MHKHQLGCYQYINWRHKWSVILGKVVKPFLMAINRIQDHNILLIFGHKFFIRRSFTICSVFLDKCISCDFCDYLKPLLLIPFRSGRNGQSFSYRYANRYQNTPRSTSGQISGRFKPFRSFQTISANFGRDVNSSRYMI